MTPSTPDTPLAPVAGKKCVGKLDTVNNASSAQRKSYRKLDPVEQDKFDELLVSLIMDKPQLTNFKLDPALRTLEKVAYIWQEIQENLFAGN